MLVDIDPGMGRTGIRPAMAPLRWCEQVAGAAISNSRSAMLCGQVQHLELPNERRDKSLSAHQEFGELRDRLKEAGLAPAILTGGGTGTFDIDPDAPCSPTSGRLLRLHGSSI